jgi:hypothetical protein
MLQVVPVRRDDLGCFELVSGLFGCTDRERHSDRIGRHRVLLLLALTTRE